MENCCEVLLAEKNALDVGYKVKDAEAEAASACLRRVTEELAQTKHQMASALVPDAVINGYKQSADYQLALETAVEDFRKSRTFAEAIAGESKKLFPHIIECCRSFFKNDLARPREEFNAYFRVWRAQVKEVKTKEVAAQSRIDVGGSKTKGKSVL